MSAKVLRLGLQGGWGRAEAGEGGWAVSGLWGHFESTGFESPFKAQDLTHSEENLAAEDTGKGLRARSRETGQEAAAQPRRDQVAAWDSGSGRAERRGSWIHLEGRTAGPANGPNMGRERKGGRRWPEGAAETPRSRGGRVQERRAQGVWTLMRSQSFELPHMSPSTQPPPCPPPQSSHQPASTTRVRQAALSYVL